MHQRVHYIRIDTGIIFFLKNCYNLQFVFKTERSEGVIGMFNNGKWKWKVAAGLFSITLLILLSAAQVPQRTLDVPFVPTPEEVVEAMLNLGDVGEDDVLYDLGCGDGRIVITAAKKFGCRGVGIDIDPDRIKESRENAVKEGVEDKVEFLLMDLFEADLSDASVVTLYLLSGVNLRLRPKLLRELNPGTRVVSHDFDMGNWKADKETFIEDDWEVHSVYLWIIPANVTGTWTWTMKTDSKNTKFTLKLDQTFQNVTGKIHEGTLALPVSIKEGKVSGNTLQFALERRRKGQREHLLFEGIVKGHSIEGNVRTEGIDKIERWKAKRDPSTLVPIDNVVGELDTITR